MSQRERGEAKTLKNGKSVKHDESNFKDNDKLKLTDATDSTHTQLWSRTRSKIRSRVGVFGCTTLVVLNHYLEGGEGVI